MLTEMICAQENAKVEYFLDGGLISRHGLESQSHLEEPFVSKREKYLQTVET